MIRFLPLLLGVLFSLTNNNLLQASKFLIIESRSVHVTHTMDIRWKNAAIGQGHQADIAYATILDHPDSLARYDVLVLSNARTDISTARMMNIKDFHQQGKPVYIQAEYKSNYPGSAIFRWLVEEDGGSFFWNGSVGVTDTIALNPEVFRNNPPALNGFYFWYAGVGMGDENVTPWITASNQDAGFRYCSPDPAHGVVFTCGDQDWIFKGIGLNLLDWMVGELALNLYQRSSITPVLTASNTNPCPKTPVLFKLEQVPAGGKVTWYLNGQQIVGLNNLSWSSTNMKDGDVVEAEVQLQTSCHNVHWKSDPITIEWLAPQIDFTVAIEGKKQICSGERLTLEAKIAQNDPMLTPVIQWYASGKPIQGAQDQKLVVTPGQGTTNFECKLVYVTSCGDTLVFGSQVHEVQTEELAVNVATSAEECESKNGKAELLNVPSGSTIAWANGNTDKMLTQLAAGSYAVTVTSPVGCVQTLDAIVQQGASSPKAQVQLDAPAGCQAESQVSVYPAQDGNWNYRWLDADGAVVATSQVVQGLNAGDYLVEVSAQGGACKEKYNITIPETGKPGLVVSEEVVSAKLGQKVVLEASSNQNVSFQWSPTTNATCTTCQSLEFTATKSTTIEVTATNDEGCTVKSMIKVYVSRPDGVQVPTAFSPNLDGENDELSIFTDESVARIIRFQVYDRYGAVLFEASNFQSPTGAMGWNGKQGIHDLGHGVYAWIMEVEYIDGERKTLSGDATLMR